METTVTILKADDVRFATPAVVDDETTRKYYQRDFNETIGEAKVHHYTGFDHGRTNGARKSRPAATPDFDVTIRLTEDDEPLERIATIVANNVPESGNVAPGEPVAIAKVALTEDDYDDDSRWYMLISRTATNALELSRVLVSHDGEPKELFQETRIFEEE